MTTNSGGCYARALGGCKGKINREHPLSESLLLRLGEMEVEAPWLPGGRRPLTASTMVARVLCEAHNAALSPFDTEACKLFDALVAHSRRQLTGWQIIRGSHIERWALKILFADVAAAKIRALDGTQPAKQEPPEDWLRIVFDGAPLPRGCGLHWWPESPKKNEAVLGVHYNYSPKTDPYPETVIGVTIQLLDVYFVVAMRPLDVAGWKVIHRPDGFSSWGSQSAGIRFDWNVA